MTLMLRLDLLATIIWLWFTCHVSHAATVYVDSNSTVEAVGCGKDLATACRTIADGFKAASTADIIDIQPGLYTGEGNENLNSVNFTATQLVISGNTGDPNDVVIMCSSPNRFLAADVQLYTIIRDLTIRNCSSLVTTADIVGAGGALLLTGVNSAVVVSNVIFFGNKARNGGAIFLESGSLTLRNCLFDANEAQYWGGAVNFIDSGLTVDSSVMRCNRAHGDLGDSQVIVDTDQAGKGGAIHGNGGSRLSLLTSEFTDNSARLSGGAVFLNLVSGLTLLDCIFHSNTAAGGDACSSDQVCQVRGGGIYVKDVAVMMINSSFVANSAITQDLSQYAEGGAIVLATDVFSSNRIESFISNCSFVNNTARGAGENNAGGYGGAVYSSGIPVSISRSDFVGNYVQSEGLFSEYASGGGAVYIASSAAGEIIDSEFSRNFADGGCAGAVYITESSVILMRNNTFILNAAYSSYVVKGQGGAVGIGQKSTGQIESCRFLNNFASPKLGVYPKTYSGFGGAIFARSSSGMLSDCYFAVNTADSGQFDSGGQGGAIGLENVRDFNIYSSVFMLNSARGFYGTNSYSSSGAGGAVCLLFSSTTFIDCLFLDNFASAGGSQYSIGGGVAIFYEYTSDGVSDAPLAFSNCKFARNVAGGEMCALTPVYRAGQGGGLGVVGVSAGEVVINVTSFEENMAMTESEELVSSYGGAVMYAQGSSVSCNDCTFNKNLAWNGLGDDICSGLDDVSYSTVLDMKLSRPILHSASDMEAMKIQERFLLLKSVFCVELSQDTLSERGADLVFDASAMDRDLLRAIRGSLLDVSMNHGPWEEMSRRHLSLLTRVADLPAVDAVKEFSGESGLSPLRAGRAEKEQSGGTANDLLGMDFTLPSRRGRRLADVKSRIYPSMLFLSGSASIYLPTYNNSYEICVGDLISVIVGLAEDTGVPSVTTSGKTPELTVIGSINSSDLVLVAVSANITVVDQSPRSSIALRSLGLLNSTFFFSNNVSVDQGGAFIGSTLSSFVPPNISNVTVDKNYMPVLNMLGSLFTGLGSGDKFQSELEVIGLLRRTEHEPTTRLERCTLRIYGSLYLSAVSTNSSDPKMVSIYLTSNSTVILTRNSRLFSMSPAQIVAETASNIALVNFGTMYLAGSEPSYLHQLSIFGVLVQLDPGTLIFSLSNENYVTPALVASTNVSLLGTINITADSSTVYRPSETGNPTEWHGLEFTTVSAARDDVNATRYVYPTGIYFTDTISHSGAAVAQTDEGSGEYSEELLQREMSYASAVVAQAMATSTATGASYTQVFTTSAMACPQRYTKYDTGGETDLDYMCFVCLKNHSCGFCDSDGCVDKGGSCPSGDTKKKDGNCCPRMCHNRGDCVHSEGHTVFRCKCDFFWAGESCSGLSVPAYLLIASVVCIMVIALITLRYYYYYRQQKKMVLQELRVGLLTGNTDDTGGSENRSYLQSIQQDLILRDVFVNYSEIQFEGKIGEGSFGEVFKASFRGAQVAVKQMRAPVFMQLTENDIEEFRTEAYMMSRLRHPNIVLVMGVSIVSLVLPGPPPGFDDDDTGNSGVSTSDDKRTRSKSSAEKKDEKVVRSICIITEYLEQGSLADILYGSNKVSDDIWTYELVLTCALQAARGMLYLHSHQPPICHRDLKSSNLVVDDHWVVKVTDFGMSRIVPMKIQNIEKGIEKSNSVDLRGGQIDRADILSAALEEESARATGASGGDGKSRRGVTINEEANCSWERESMISPEEGERHSQSNTLMTSNLGTTAWCAPELLTAMNKTRYSVKVDVYSFGMVLWELWERKRPYEDLYSRFDIIDAVREGRRPTISSTCPPTLRSLIQRCWHEQPARRPTFAYIVRYVKDELAHIKRQRLSSASSFSPLHQLLLGARTKSSTSGGTVSSPELPVLGEGAISSQSVDDDSDKNWLQRGPVVKEQYVQSDAVTSRSTISSYMPPTLNLPPAPLAIPQKPSQESLNMLARSPGTNESEFPDMLAGVPPQHPSVLVGAAKKSWRDKYVMRFNGWKSSDPDTGLPPSVYSSGGLAAADCAEKKESAVAAPAPAGREGYDSPESRSQESSVDSIGDEVGMAATTLPPQGAYELDLYSSSSTVISDNQPRLPALRAIDVSSRDSRASGGEVRYHGDSSELRKGQF